MKKILIVEDSRPIADAIKIILESEGFETIHTNRGNNVLDIAKKEKIDLIILDLMMPGTNGVTVFKNLKKDPETKNIPVIILSAKADAIEKEEKIKSCDKFIPKPFENKTIIAEVKKLLKE